LGAGQPNPGHNTRILLTYFQVGESLVEAVIERVKASLRLKIVSIGPREPPEIAFSSSRGQYVSERILSWLRGFTARDRVFGLLNVDAYTPGLNFVFGQAELGGQAAVVYLARLNPEFYREPFDEKLFLTRIVKETLHELGHLFGLRHCSRRCVMSFSNSVWDVDLKPEHYCSRCRARLERLGL